LPAGAGRRRDAAALLHHLDAGHDEDAVPGVEVDGGAGHAVATIAVIPSASEGPGRVCGAPPGPPRSLAHARDDASQILNREVDQLLLELVVRRVEKLDGAEAQRLLEHAARVGERFEAVDAVRFAHAAVADAAERE